MNHLHFGLILPNYGVALSPERLAASEGRLLDEWLELARSVFAQEAGLVEHGGGLVVDDAWMAPGPGRAGGPELWVAGVSKFTLARASQTGVWHPVALPPGRLATVAADFRRRRTDGRIVLRINVSFAPEPDRDGTDERGRHAIAGPLGGSRSASTSMSKPGVAASCLTSVTTFRPSTNGLSGSRRRSGPFSVARFRLLHEPLCRAVEDVPAWLPRLARAQAGPPQSRCTESNIGQR